MRKYYNENELAVAGGITADDVLPSSFIIWPDTFDEEYEAFVARFNKVKAGTTVDRISTLQCARNLWIVKPSHTDNGWGIRIFDDVDKIMEYIKTDEAKENGGKKVPEFPKFIV